MREPVGRVETVNRRQHGPTLPGVRNESVWCLYSATSSDDMSTVIMKPVVPLYSKALSPTFQVSISLGIILKSVLRAAAK